MNLKRVQVTFFIVAIICFVINGCFYSFFYKNELFHYPDIERSNKIMLKNYEIYVNNIVFIIYNINQILIFLVAISFLLYIFTKMYYKKYHIDD